MKARLNLSASGFSTLYRPSACELRVYLMAHEAPQGEPSEWEQIIMEMGRRHERNHLATFPEARDLSEGSLADRAQRTREAVAAGTTVIYQGVLRAALPGTREVVTGSPDFMIRDGESWRIRDCKLSRSIEGGRHPEITLQLQTYGWLLESTFGKPPAALEAFLGDGSLAPVPLAPAGAVVKELTRMRDLALLPEEPWEPVGWSKCGACVFQERCWTRAEKEHDVSMVFRIDAATARALRERGIATYDDLLATMDDVGLAGLKRRRGMREQKVGAAAGRILAQARALASGKVEALAPLELPQGRVLAMFDLEGVPPQYDELDRVYLWGLAVYTDGRKGPFIPSVAGFGPDGDREGWESFLKSARSIFAEHGDVPFVHWADYEKTKVKSYTARYGDPGGVAARVLANCFDLLPAVRDAFALPVPSYSLKVIERLSGYERSMEDYGGDWAIGRFIRAEESGDESEREAIMKEILRYNDEDLEATWAVLQWAAGLAGGRAGPQAPRVS